MPETADETMEREASRLVRPCCRLPLLGGPSRSEPYERDSRDGEPRDDSPRDCSPVLFVVLVSVRLSPNSRAMPASPHALAKSN